MISTPGRRRPLFARVACLVGWAIGSAGWSSYAAAAAAPATSSGSFDRQDGFLLPPSQEQQQGTGRLALVMPVSKLSLAFAGIAYWMESCSDDFDLPVDLILYVDPEEARAYDLETRTSSRAALLDMVTCFEDFKVVTGENVSERSSINNRARGRKTGVRTPES